MSKTTTTPLRDRFAHAVANWVINTFATEKYRQNLEYVYQVGVLQLEKMAADAKDEEKTRAMLGLPPKENS